MIDSVLDTPLVMMRASIYLCQDQQTSFIVYSLYSDILALFTLIREF